MSEMQILYLLLGIIYVVIEFSHKEARAPKKEETNPPSITQQNRQ
jgi:hypothetical protein